MDASYTIIRSCDDTDTTEYHPEDTINRGSRLDATSLQTQFHAHDAVGRRKLLLKIGPALEAPISLLTFSPDAEDTEAFVVDQDTCFEVGSRVTALETAASLLGISVFDPVESKTSDGAVAWVVWGQSITHDGSGGGSIQSFEIGTGKSPAEATAATQTWLEMMVGSTVMSAADWLLVMGDHYREMYRTVRQKKVKRFALPFTALLEGKRMATGVYQWSYQEPEAELNILEEEALSMLSEPGSLSRVERDKRRSAAYELRLVKADGTTYANFHDLVTAASHGIYVPEIRPWPNFQANAFVIIRTFWRYLRAHGWRQPWKDEEPKHTTELFGTRWVRDLPIQE